MGRANNEYSTIFCRESTQEEICVTIRVNSWGEQPQTSGPPERCHDGSPPEGEIIESFFLLEAGEPEKTSVNLTPAEEEYILDEFFQSPPEDDPDEKRQKYQDSLLEQEYDWGEPMGQEEW